MILMASAFYLLLWMVGYSGAGLLDRLSPLEWRYKFILAFPLGLGITGWFAFYASMLGLPINAGLMYPLLMAGLFWCLFLMYRHFRRTGISSLISSLKIRHRFSLPQTLVVLSVFLILLRYLLDHLTLPIVHYDAFYYHLPYAQIIFETHQLPVFSSPSHIDFSFAHPPLYFLFLANLWLWLGKPTLFLQIFTFVSFLHLFFLLYLISRKTLQVNGAATLADATHPHHDGYAAAVRRLHC